MKNKNACILIGIFAHLFLSFVNKSSPACEKLKNGKFYYYTKKTRERINILRIDTLQLETGLKKGDSPIKNKIVWKGDCMYDIFLNALSETRLTETDSIIARTPAHVQIFYIGKTYYICSVKLNVFNKNIDLKDTIYFRN